MSDMLTQTPATLEALQAVRPQAIPVHELDGEPEFRIRPITVAEYNRMAEVGILAPDEHVELVDGLLIVPPPPQGAPHVSIILRMHDRLHARFGKRILITSQVPIIVSERSEPEPDFALVGWRDDFYASAIPTNADAVAVVEVSDTTLRMDRGRKRTVYARAGIPEYWIVDVRAKQIEIHRDPHDDTYAEPRIAKKGETVAFAAFPDVVFTVDELLG